MNGRMNRWTDGWMNRWSDVDVNHKELCIQTIIPVLLGQEISCGTLVDFGLGLFFITFDSINCQSGSRSGNQTQSHII